jgi:DNA-binding MarR family transcriptional regulator
MDDAMITDVRRFNRTVTAQVGALDDRFLGRDRPLGEARLLWEIGPAGADLRSLRARIGLDSGYLSRMLRALESAGLVAVDADPGDRRSRVARLTDAGLAERAALDERSDDLARTLLAPLNEPQRERLVAAMRDVERLLTAGLVELRDTDPEHPDARRCVAAYIAELEEREGRRFDPAAGSTAEPDELRPPKGLMLVAYLRGGAVGCGAMKHHDGWSEPKRVWVSREVRGLGLGRRIVAELEARASAAGSRAIRLDTNRHLTEAITLYRASGYVEIPPFTDEPFAHHWFEKRLDG